jgi:hypothetical protein
MRFYLLMLWIGLMSSAIGCSKKPANEPEIKYVGVSKNFMPQNKQDSMILEFSFIDGDGDLGNDSEDAIFVRDSRDNSLVATYQIPQHLQSDKKKCQEGTITLVIYSRCCVYADSSSCYPNGNVGLDSLYYSLQMRDRAGNWSNTIQSELIELDCSR